MIYLRLYQCKVVCVNVCSSVSEICDVLVPDPLGDVLECLNKTLKDLLKSLMVNSYVLCVIEGIIQTRRGLKIPLSAVVQMMTMLNTALLVSELKQLKWFVFS